MLREIPEWLRKEREAVAARVTAMSPEDAAARKEFYRERSADRARRKAARIEAAAFINQRLMLGDKPEEIAKALGVTVGALRARRWGHVLFERKGYRRVPVWLADRDVAELDAIAAEMGVAQTKAFCLLIEAVFQDRAFVARRTLGLRQKKDRAAA